MKIAYIQKTTLIDYPGEIASTVFLRGCNFNCSFCYNKSLITFQKNENDIDQDQCLDILLSRRDKIDHIVITGGEPTANYGLLEFLKILKNNGFKVKLDTNGSNPTILESALKSDLIDYVAIDIKTSPESYCEITRSGGHKNLVLQSMKILKMLGKDYEFRTTVWKEHFSIDRFNDIFNFTKDYVKYYFLQNYFSANKDFSFSSFSMQEIKPIVDLAEQYGINLRLRGDWR